MSKEALIDKMLHITFQKKKDKSLIMFTTLNKVRIIKRKNCKSFDPLNDEE